MAQLKPNGARAKNAIILTWALVALQFLTIVSSLMQYGLLQRIAGGEYVSENVLVANDLREGAIGWVYTVFYIIWLVFFIMWFRRAYYNLHQKVSHLDHSEGWAAGSWFVPIISLYRPYQIMKEIFLETKNLLDKKGYSEEVHYKTGYLGLWWALWLITGFIAWFIFRAGFMGGTRLDDISLTVAEIIQGVLEIPLALLIIKIIKDYSAVEPLLAQPDDVGRAADTVPE